MKIYLKLLLTAIFWGGTFVAGRVVARNVGPYSIAFLRFTIASILLLLLTWRIEGGLPKLKKPQIIPVVEKINLIKGLGIVISVCGAIIAISKGNISRIFQGGLGLGEFYIFCCVLSWVAYSLIGKTVMKGLSPLTSVSYSATVGAVALSVPALFEGLVENIAGQSVFDWLCISYLGVFGTVIGFVWYYQGVKCIGPTKAGLFINFVPISAILCAFFILREPVTLSLTVGAVLVISGVYLTNRTVNEDSVITDSRRNPD